MDKQRTALTSPKKKVLIFYEKVFVFHKTDSCRVTESKEIIFNKFELNFWLMKFGFNMTSCQKVLSVRLYSLAVQKN